MLLTTLVAYRRKLLYKLWRKIVKINKIVKKNEDLDAIIATLRSTTANLLGFRCES